MSDLSSEKLNNKRNLLSVIVLLVITVFSVNLSLVTDPYLFVGFYIVAATAGAWLSSAKNPIMVICASLLGWAASLWITGNAVYALLSISYLPFSLAIPFVAKGKLTRTSAIGISSAFVTLAAASVLLYVTYFRVDTVSLSAVRAAFPYFFKTVSEMLFESFFVDVAGSKVSLIAESNVTGYLNVIICVFPAVLSAVLTILGFLIAWLYRKTTELTSASFIDDKHWAIVPSSITAVFFIIALVAVLIFDTVSLVSLTALNMFIIILPIILTTGLLTSLSPKVINGIPRPRLFRPLTLIISVFNGVVPFASLCIFYGLFDSIRASIPKRKPKNQD